MSEAKVFYVLSRADEKNLSPHELRIYASRAVFSALLVFVFLYLFLAWLVFVPLNVGWVQTWEVPMGSFLIHPVRITQVMFHNSMLEGWLCLGKVSMILGLSVLSAVAALKSHWQVSDGYKHVAGRRYIKNAVQAERLLIAELKQNSPDLEKYPKKMSMVIDGKFALSNALLGGHLVVPGPPGSGKTAFLERFLVEIIQQDGSNGQLPAYLVLHDIKGDFTAKIFDPEYCVLLNPLDRRSVPLLVGKDINNKVLAAEFAVSTIPEDKNNKFFTDAAREIRSGLIWKLQADLGEGWSFADLLKLELLPCLDMKAVIDEFNPVASHYLEDHTSKMTASVLSTLSANSKAIAQLAEAYDGLDLSQGFSVRQWLGNIAHAGKLVKGPDGKKKRIKPPKTRILILQNNGNYTSLCKAYMGAVMASLANVANSPEFPEDPDRKLFVILDEFFQMGRLNFESLLSTGRSKGVKNILLFQSWHQIFDLYGTEQAKSIVDNCSHAVYLGGNSRDSVKEVCELLGKRTVVAWKGSDNLNAQGVSHNYSYNTEQVPIILESEIQADFGAKLDGVYGLVNFARSDYVYRIRFPYVSYPWKTNQPFVLAEWVIKGSAKGKVAAIFAQSRVEQDAQFEAFKTMLVGESQSVLVGTLEVGNGRGEVLEIGLNEAREVTADIVFDLICHEASALCHALEFVDSIGTGMNHNQTFVVEEVELSEEGRQHSKSVATRNKLERNW